MQLMMFEAAPVCPQPSQFGENVPGVFSTKDNAFGCFLAGLSGEDVELLPAGGRWTDAGCVLGPRRAIAWRCLDSQYFGLAQRRKRVFVVASARDGFSPPEVLFEWGGVRRDTPPRRGAPQDVAGTIAAGFARSRGSEMPPEFCVGVEIGPSGGRFSELNPTLDTRAKDGPIRNQLAGAVLTSPIAFHPTQGPITSTDGSVHALGCGSSSGEVISQTLRAKEHEPPMVVAFDSKASNAIFNADLSPTLIKNGEDGGGRIAIQMPTTAQVRRLTPVECERLQGFPDCYTAIPWRGKPADQCPDGPRYKAIGNSWAVPVARWVGERVNNAISKSK